MVAIPAQIGYPALFGLIGAESAGVPLPGEASLIAAGVLAGSGRLALPLVILTAACAIVLGATAGYWIGRRGGRAALDHAGPWREPRRRALARGERFFARHGATAVFFGRFVPGVRVVTALTAGACGMAWAPFAFYTALAAVVWPATIAGLASLVGPAAATAFAVAAVVTLIAFGVAALTHSPVRTGAPDG